MNKQNKTNECISMNRFIYVDSRQLLY